MSNLTLQDLANIYPALMIAAKSEKTSRQDMSIWIDLAGKIELILNEHQTKNNPASDTP